MGDLSLFPETAPPATSEVTKLAPAQEAQFQSWVQTNGITDVDHPDSHYDYRGFWQASGGAPHPTGTHYPDTFKQHGHPTFSVESQYSTGPDDGGRWNGDTFQPSGGGISLFPTDTQDPLNQAVARAPGTPADTAARIFKLRLQTGLPTELISRNLEEVEKQAATTGFNAAQFRQQTPALAQWLGADPLHAAVSQDDLANMGALEWLVKMPAHAIAQAMNEQAYGVLRSKEVLFGGLSPQEHDQLESYKFQVAHDADLGAGEGWFAGALTKGMKLVTALTLPQARQTAIGAVVGGTLGGAAGALAGPEAIPAGIVQGARFGAKAGYTVGLAQNTFLATVGPSYDKFLALPDEFGHPLDPAVAKGAAVLEATINSGLMVGAGEVALHAIPGWEKLTGSFARSAIETALQQPTVRQKLAQAVLASGKTLTAGAALSLAQEGLSIMTESLAKTASGQPFAPLSTEEVKQRMGHAFAEGIQSFALLAAGGPALALPAELRRAQAGAANQAVFTALAEGASQSKTLARSPDAVQAFLAHATKDGPVQDVYAPVADWTTYWQSKGIDPAQMAEKVGSSREAYQQAVDAGHDLMIPTAGYAATLAATEHAPHFAEQLKLHPDEMNGAEAKAYLEAQAQAATVPPVSAEAPPSGATTQMHADLVNQLQATGMTATDANTNAAVVSQFLDKFIEGRAGLPAGPLFEARFGGVERTPSPETIGLGQPPVGPLSEAEITQLLATPETVHALDRRTSEALSLPPGGVERRQPRSADEILAANRAASDEPINAMADVAAAARRMLAEDPNIRQRAQDLAARDRAVRSGVVPPDAPYSGTPTFWGYEPGPDGQPLAKFTVQTETGPTQRSKADLEALGMTVPDPPPPPVKQLSGDELRRLALAARATGTLYQTVPPDNQEPAPTFFSRIVRAVETSSLAKASGSQWVATIKNAKAGINAEEFAALNVAGLAPPVKDVGQLGLFSGQTQLAGEKVYTKQEVLDYLAENTLKVEPVILGGATVTDDQFSDEVDRLVDEAVESEADRLRENYDDSDQIDRLDEQFDYPRSAVTYNEDDQLFHVTVGGEEIDTGPFDTKTQAEDGLQEHLDVLRNEFIDENYEKPDFEEMARRNIDRDDFEEVARENLGGTGEGATHYGTYSVKGPREEYQEVFLTVPNAPAPGASAAGETGPTIRVAERTIPEQGRFTNAGPGAGNVPGGRIPYDPNAEITVRPAGGNEQTGAGFAIFIDGQKWLDADGEIVRPGGQNAEEALQEAHALYREAGLPAIRPTGEPAPTAGWEDGHGDYKDIENPWVRLRVDTRYSTGGEGAALKVLFINEAQPPQKDQQEKIPVILKGAGGKMPYQAALKWALLHAVATEHDAIAWATGKQSADFYSLERQIARIAWGPADPNSPGRRAEGGVKWITFEPKDGGTIRITVDAENRITDSSHERLRNEALASVVEQEYVDQIAATPAGDLTGPKLVYGGAGLKRLYDKDLVNIANSLAPMKAAKARVGAVSIDARDPSYRSTPQGENPVTGIIPDDNGGLTLQLADGTTWGHYEMTAGAESARDRWNADIEARGSQTSAQPGIVLTPELKAALRGGVPMFQSASGEPQRRAGITFDPTTGRALISLFAKADRTSFLHEFAHLGLELTGDVVDELTKLAPGDRSPSQQRVLDDFEKILLPWLGVKTRADIGPAQHEQFAEAWEDYLMAGKAPSAELRPIFARLKAWMIGVYKNVQRTVTLTPDVRGFMDRLLASDEEIAAQEAQARFTPIFTDAKAAGMTPETFELYRKTVEAASTQAREQLDRQAVTDYRREQSKTYADQRAGVEAAVTAELHQQPVYQALAAIRYGTEPNGDPIEPATADTPPVPMKLDRAEVVKILGEAKTKTLPRPYVYTREGGMDPRVVADAFGFSSAHELLTAIADAPALEDAIRQTTQERMLAEHGGLFLDGTLPEQAQLALANDARDRLIRVELRALGKLKRTVAPFVRAAEAGKQTQINALADQATAQARATRRGPATIAAGVPPQAVIEQAAQARIAQTKLQDLRPEVFWSAAREANQRAIAAAARQDFQGAITAQTQHLQNLAFYREARKALSDTETRVLTARALDSVASRKRLGRAGLGIQAQIDGILDRYDFATITGPALTRRLSMRDWVANLEGQGLPVDLPDAVLDDARRVNYKELTHAELVDVSDGLQQLVHLAQMSNRLFKSKQAATLSELATTLSGSIRESFTGTPPTIARDRSTGESGRLWSNFGLSHVRLADFMRQLDGGEDGGPMSTAFSLPLNEAGAREADLNAEATRRLGDTVETAYPRSEKARLYEKQAIPALGAGVSLSRMERLMIALNWGNEGSRDRQRAYEGWSDQQVQAILDTLDARDLKFVQGVLDQINSYKGEIVAKQTRVYGVAPTMIDPAPITAKAGTIPGGYFPLKYDDRLSATAARNLDLEAGNLAKLAAYTTATTARGFTKERLSYVKLPIRRDFGPIYEHLGQVIHDLTHHEVLIDLGRVLNRPEVQGAIYGTYGDQTYKEIKSAIRDVAYGTAGPQNGFERAMGSFRSGSAISALGWSLTVPLLHLSGALPKGINRVGAGWFVQGLGRWVRGPESMQGTTEWIYANNRGMANRGRTQQREINEIRNSVGVHTGRFSGWVAEAIDKASFGLADKQKIVDSYFYLVAKSQQVADISVYLGQFEKSRAAGEPEPRAHAIAEQAVLDAFGGGQMKDLPAVMRGGALLKVWTTFYGPFNSTFNLMRAATKGTTFSDPVSVGRLAVDYLMIWSAPAILGLGVRYALNPNATPDDWDLASEFAKAHLSYLADMMLGTRELAGVIHGYHGYEGPAGASLFAKLTKAYEQGATAVGHLREGAPASEALPPLFWAAVDAGGVLFHYPAAQLQRTAGGLAALLEGQTMNPAVLVTGAPKAP